MTELLPTFTDAHLTAGDAALKVELTINMNGTIQNRRYPDCFATQKNGVTLVFAYADGVNAKARAVWTDHGSIHVVAVEHYGDHPGAQQWMTAGNAPEAAPVAPQAAGPDYPRTVIVQATHEGPESHVGRPDPLAELSPAALDETNGDITKHTAVGTIPPYKGMTEELGYLEKEDILGTSTGADLEKPEEQTAWIPPVEPVEPKEEGWRPAGRSTQHKEAKPGPRRSPKGKAAGVLKTTAALAMLGFAMLGFTPHN
jgi:hypothetical protein